MPATMQNMIQSTGLTRDAVNKIMTRNMRTEIVPAEPGKPRYFSRENALELLMIAALQGVDGQDAAVIAGHWILMERKGELPAFWVFGTRSESFRKTGDLNGYGFASPNMSVQALLGSGDLIEGESDDTFLAVKIVDLAGIVRRVDAMIAEETVEA